MNYNNGLEYDSIRSYGGIYFTDNIVTALSSARKSSTDKEWKTLIVARLETKSPHIILDEDLLRNPGYEIENAVGFLVPRDGYPDHLAYFITTSLPQKTNEIVDNYMKNIFLSRHPVSHPQMIEQIKKYVVELVRSYCTRLLAEQIKNYFGNGSYYNKNEFDKKFPQFANLDVATEEGKYRQAADTLLKKVHQVTEYVQNSFQYNVRSMAPVSYRGSNKIVLVAKFRDVPYSNEMEYNEEIQIFYLSEPQAVQQMINDVKQRLGNSFKVTYGNQTLYDVKKVKN